ncbi:MAG: putative Ribokinase [Parcubacteria group bacterium Gr01-1014_72]|nr:MAG: putative Ribokinase [Parcubacteria group bacterium Gr01-1014_72]
MTQPLDFLAIGDITTDAFIRLKDAEVHCRVDTDECEICMPFAEKIPYEFVEVVPAVGNSPNAAVAVARLGLSTALVANRGDDQNGRDCLAQIEKENIATDFINAHKGAKTNYHYVLWYHEDRTILVKHESYPYRLPAISPAPRFVYLSSIGGGTEAYHDEIADWLELNPETKLAFQPGTFQMNLGKERLARLYRRTDIFAVNVGEARRILKGEGEPAELLPAIQALGPKVVLISDGPKGAYMREGSESWFMPIYPDPKPPYERTGAGDAFSSTFVAALALGKNSAEALRWAMINPMSVVQYVGAQKGLLSRKALEEYLENAPKEYVPATIL